jgi:N utilization substance protein B
MVVRINMDADDLTSKVELNSKSIARIAAIQTIYQLNATDSYNDIDGILMRIISFYKDQDIKSDYELDQNLQLKMKPSVNYLKELVQYTKTNLTELDEIITNHLINDKNLEHLPRLLLAILRVAICELRYFPEIPYKVVINEYTDIAGDMLDTREIGLVNSLLDKYYNEYLHKAN